MTGAGWIALIIVGVAAGFLATYARLWRKQMPGGWIVGVIGGLVGAYLGGVFLGTWGWMLGGLNVIGSIVGALVVSYLVETFGPQISPQSRG